MKMIEEYEMHQLQISTEKKADKAEEVNELWNDLITYQQDPAMERQMSKLSKEMKEFFEDVNIDIRKEFEDS
jgi:predicted transcriptional regulator